ncbi:unnamed protein product [Angiostrongylus costaricensis]|uniref:Endo/exonuclease/phosphatase domain-containing protein n=1 Tax=Angiostrongylus costaricensis TaxID=334426 RepID=A0A0R3PRG8_ANGCS|nr:unnamed protein product [Angiostrongylus costaricensis]
MMTICTYNAHTLASESSIKDLLMQARGIRYDVIGLAETRRHHPFNAVYDTGKELLLGTCDSRGIGGVVVLVNTGSQEDAVVDNIYEEYDRLTQHLHVSAMKAESSKVTKRRLYPETLKLIRQRGIARAEGNCERTSELAKQCRQAIKEDLREKSSSNDRSYRGWESIRIAHRSFANYRTKMIALRRPDGTVTSSKKAVEKIIHEYYSDLFDSYVHLPSYELNEDGYVVPPILPSEIRHAISSVKNRTALGREINMMNDLAPWLSRRERAAWGTFKSIKNMVKRTKNTRLRAHLFDSMVVPALTTREVDSLVHQRQFAASLQGYISEYRAELSMYRLFNERDTVKAGNLESNVGHAAFIVEAQKQGRRRNKVMMRSAADSYLLIAKGLICSTGAPLHWIQLSATAITIWREGPVVDHRLD